MDALGNPIALALTPGQTHDLVAAPDLLAQADPQAVTADKAFDAWPDRDFGPGPVRLLHGGWCG